MTIAISTISDERLFNRYLSLRNAPRDTLVYGVHPNSHKAITEYEALVTALDGELSSIVGYHADAVASVAPFVAALQAAMHTINDTMHIVNLLATATGQDEPFAIPAEEITVQDYIATLQDAIATLTATMQATQRAAQALGGGQ